MSTVFAKSETVRGDWFVVDATDKVDSAVRAVSDAVQKPAKAAAGFTDGVSHAFETFRAKRDRRGGVL